MYVSYNWLCEILPGLDKIAPREIADRLTLSGLEVEEYIDQGAKLSGIVVGEVLTRDKHPNADKLSLCRVNAGVGEYQVVCGAPNVTAGKKYPFATLGTTMPDGLVIKPIKLRGVESLGMLCSAKELQLSGDTDGLYELAAEARVGAPIAEALGLNDVIFGLNVTPNRGDALSHWGVARDIAALTGLTPDFSSVAPRAAGVASGQSEKNSSAPLTVALADARGCPRYSASTITGVRVAPSPQWLKNRLESLGLRAINNVVDATNYVMLLTGHPVHAFDAANVAGNAIAIAALNSPRRFKTLDGQERELVAGDVVIQDAKDVIALAGIMGGENSEVKESTRDLILEVAFFAPDAIRRTSRRLGLQTDSSYRFARFVNPDTVLQAHGILRDLIIALAGGEAGSIQDIYPEPLKPQTVSLAVSEIERLLGIVVPSADVRRILTGLGCAVKEEGETLVVGVPMARSDLTRPADIVEEIARVYGMDRIPAEMPRLNIHVAEESRASASEREVKDFFVARGFVETVHYSFGEAAFFAKVLKRSADSFLMLKNPLSADLAAMRPSLLPQLIESFKKNRLNSDKGLKLFELRKVYDAGSERRILAGLLAGNPYGRNPYGITRASDFYESKGLVADFLAHAGVTVTVRVGSDWPYHPGQCAEFLQGKKRIATVGALHPELLQSLKLRDALFVFEIEWDFIADTYRRGIHRYEPVSALPPVYRDLALLAPRELTHQDILNVILAEKPRELKNVELFDAYEGPNIPTGKKSLAYAFIYQPESESLTDEAVNRLHFGLVEALQRRLGVELRS